MKNLTDKGNPSVLLLIIVEKKKVNFYLVKIRKVIFASDLKIKTTKKLRYDQQTDFKNFALYA